MSDPIVIVSAARTPIGGLLGDFAGLSGWELGAVAIRAAVERAGIAGDSVDEVLMGNCLMAGQGQAPARQAVRKAGLPDSAGAVTLSKMCGSGMRAAMFGHDMLATGSADVIGKQREGNVAARGGGIVASRELGGIGVARDLQGDLLLIRTRRGHRGNHQQGESQRGRGGGKSMRARVHSDLLIF